MSGADASAEGREGDRPSGPMAGGASAPAAAGGDAAREAKQNAYQAMLDAKVRVAAATGFEPPLPINPLLKPMTREIVAWACRGGQRALFLSFGLHKTSTQLEIMRQALAYAGGHGLIVAPLGVQHEFFLEVDLRHPDIALKFVNRSDQIGAPNAPGPGKKVILICNYEPVRDGHLDPSAFTVCCALDEAACFAPGTLVNTPSGPVAIETIKVGDVILNAAGFDKVTDAFKTEIARAARVEIGGRTILCSDNHPFFTTRGWVEAAELRPGDTVVETDAAVRMVRGEHPAGEVPGSSQALLQSILLGEMAGEPSRCSGSDAASSSGSGVQDAFRPLREVAATSHLRTMRQDVLPQIQQSVEEEVLQQCLFSHLADAGPCTASDLGVRLADAGSEGAKGESRFPVVGVRVGRRGDGQGEDRQAGQDAREFCQNGVNASASRHSAQVERRQGARADRTAACLAEGARHALDLRTSGPDFAASTGLANLLLSGPCPTGEDAGDRGGRKFSQVSEGQGAGSKEGGFPSKPRVDRVEVLERGHPDLDRYRDADGRVYFHDLTAERHPSFSVEGLLVHNCLRGFGGSKTFREFMAHVAGDDRRSATDTKAVPFRFVATAIPDPNETIELLAYAAFLGVMDVGEAKTRFFKRDSEKADQLTLHPHKEEEFWLWVASWALFVQKPSDLGYSDEGYDLPDIDVRWHEIPADHSAAGTERDGQGRLLADAAHGVVEASREKKRSLDRRVAKMLELRAEDPDAHRILWHDLEAERLAIERAIPTVRTVWGTQDFGEREKRVVGFARGEIAELGTKPVLNGSGCNFQHHCWWSIYLGIGFKFHDFYQSLFRLQRFGQKHPVRVDLIYTEAERSVRRDLEQKWRAFEAQAARMSEIIRRYGLASQALAGAMKRSMGVERREVSGQGFRLVHNDAVLETMAMPADSVDLIVTSIPFSTQYEYTPSFNDFGHTDDDAHFWAQMDFLTAELLRVLRPGRVACIHVKDRIVPGGINGLGFQTVNPFSDDCIAHFRKHGFAFLSRITVATDVVRENNQTYRLGWSEQCKDGSRMGNGMPEYVLKFRKPQTDRSKGYADRPVRKAKPDFVRVIDGRPTAPGDDDFDEKRIRPVPGTGYSRGRWQLDAHGTWRSSGNRPLLPDEVARLAKIDPKLVYRSWKAWSLTHVYDHETHVAVTEALDAAGRLPPTFMIAPPHVEHDAVWTDVARMRTLNMRQKQKGREMHLCPLQFDIVDRAIVQHSMPGETVFDPFGGIMTVPYCALKLGRQAVACELSGSYFDDGVLYAREAAGAGQGPTLFDLLEAEAFAAEPAKRRTLRDLLAELQALPEDELDRAWDGVGIIPAEAAE